jgi:tRNA threonylcarbamoyl adenosine modification protein (Sua5/YciO/YrdC/YwlC family)
MIVKINKDNPQQKFIKLAADVLHKDGVIVYPTDTIYGLGCSIFSKKGVEKIMRLKQREGNKPLSFICSDISEVSKYARVTDFAFKVMKSALPGPFTFILEAKKTVPKLIQAKRKTVGIRIPDSNICLEIIKALGSPITSTSANISSEPELTEVYDIELLFRNQIGLYIDGGPLISEPSTVINLVNDDIEILRQGKGILNI